MSKRSATNSAAAVSGTRQIPLPADGWATVLVYQLGSEMEKVVSAVTSPSPEGADVLRALASQNASETLMKIRALIEASTAA